MPIVDFLGVDMCTPLVDLLEELGFESLKDLDEWVTADPINAVQLDVYLNGIAECARSLQKRISKTHAEFFDGLARTKHSSRFRAGEEKEAKSEEEEEERKMIVNATD